MAERENREQAFRHIEGEFIRLRRHYLSRKITQPEFVAELKKLRLRDEIGRYWTIGAQSGKWYYFDGRNWVRADPPANELASPEEGAVSPEVLSRVQTKTNDAAGVAEAAGEQKQIPGAPEIAALRSNLSLEILGNHEERWVMAALPFLPTALFAGGLALFLGIVAGAVVGSTSFFLGKLSFLPSFFQEIQGKLTGGLIFAGLGGLFGLLTGGLFGLLAALFFNLSSSLTGGLIIKVQRTKEEKKP